MAPNGVGSRPRLILASASPRRRELLGALGLAFEVLPVDVDETPQVGESAPVLVERLARSKAAEGLARVEARGEEAGTRPPVVIGADTVVVVDDEVFGKPTCDAEARTMLSRLSGRWHDVFSGVAVASAAGIESAVERTVVHVRELSAAEIDCYVATGEPMDKAGAYGIQGRAGVFVDRLEGSYHNVVGLPLHVVDLLCRRIGLSLTTCKERSS